MQQHPKVVVIGAGSLFFGRQAIWQMIHSEHLQTGTLALVDTDADRLRKLQTLAQRVVDHIGAPLAVEASIDHRDVLDGADFVVLSFAQDTVRYRGIDCEVSARHGVRMCSGDTIGPGGVFRTLRELPAILRVARDIEDRCPDAWVINYINPSATHGIALQRFAPRLKSFALCDGLHMPHVKQNDAIRAGIIERKEDYTPDTDAAFDFRVAGLNMPDDAFLELLCDVDMEGPRPRPVGPMPLGLRGLMQQVLDTHELTAEAAACDHDLLRRALATDPLTSSIADLDAIIAELLDAERDVLPEAWAARTSASIA